MELSVRDWMVIVGVLLIVVVLVDGFRRVRNDRRDNIRMSLNKQYLNASDNPEEDYSSELPGGGARVVSRKEDDLQLDHSVPMLMESVKAEALEEKAVEKEIIKDNTAPSTDFSAIETPDEEREDEEEPSSIASVEYNSIDSKGVLSDLASKEVIVVNVMAKGEPFKGDDLLQILLACDCRFGDMNIFHRYENASGKGPIQFSVANIVEPGVFDLEAIDGFSTPGVSFFMGIPGPEDPSQAFEYMVETAQCLVKNLNGELLDESRSVMTSQTLAHNRQKINDIKRKQLAQHA